MNRSAVSFLVVAWALAGAVQAKDLCVEDQSGRQYRFESPKIPKKLGKVYPLVGSVRTVPAGVDAFAWGPVYGSSMAFIGGVEDLIVVSITAHTSNAIHELRMVVDRDFVGEGLGDFTGDGSPSTSIEWLAMDCDDSTLP